MTRRIAELLRHPKRNATRCSRTSSRPCNACGISLRCSKSLQEPGVAGSARMTLARPSGGVTWGCETWAAIDRDRLAGQVGRCVAGEEEDRGRDLVWSSDPAESRGFPERLDVESRDAPRV